MIKLHLGCDKRYLPGYIHVDLNHYDHIDYQSDFKSLPMFGDNSVDEIYNCNALEYLDRDEVGMVLAEWYRILKLGAILRLSVPNFSAICQIYLKYNDLDCQGILGPLYGKWLIGDNYVYHKTVYDFNSLKKVLEAANFTNIRIYDPNVVFGVDYDDYSKAYIPHMDNTGILVCLNVEATK